MGVIKGTFSVTGEYTMKATVEDGTASLEAKLSHKVSTKCQKLRLGNRTPYRIVP